MSEAEGRERTLGCDAGTSRRGCHDAPHALDRSRHPRPRDVGIRRLDLLRESELRAGGWEIGESPTNAVTATNGSSTVMLFAAPDPAGGTTIYMITEEGGSN